MAQRAAQPQEDSRVLPREETDSPVRLFVEHGIELPLDQGLGFRITVSGWNPSGELSVFGMDTKGRVVPLLDGKGAFKASSDGVALISVSYGLQALRIGHWSIFVAGRPGTHLIKMKVPKVERSLSNRSQWKLNFQAADDYEKSIKEPQRKRK